MKRIIYISIVLFLLILAAGIFIKPVIIFLAEKQLKNLFAKSGVLAEGVTLETLNMSSIIRGNLAADFSVQKIQYDKLRIDGVRGRALLKGRRVTINPLYAQVLAGKSSGDIVFIIGKSAKYSANLKFTGLSMEKFIKDFNLGEKLQLSGKLGGSIALSGEGSNIKALNGNFSTIGTGGLLIIKDNKFLENIAHNSGQSLDILMENFKDYHYNTGLLQLSFDKGKLILDIALDGEAGKRNLNITLHDFKIGRGGI
jgi:hypothetical protein